MNVLLKRIRIFSPEQKINSVKSILIVDGVVQEISNKIDYDPKDLEVIDGSDLTCVPGLFDMHVHFREPGQTHKETISSGASAAMNGGFTGVLCMPNTIPPLDSPVLIENLINKYRDHLVDINFTGCVTKAKEGKELANLMSLKDAGIKGFTDDGSPVEDPLLMKHALQYCKQLDMVFIQHAESMRLSDNGAMNEGKYSEQMGLKGIPAVGETAIVARDILMVKYVKGSRYHLQHISCEDSVELIRRAKRDGLNVTTEACPHHFILTDKQCLNFNTNAKMNPPLRTEKDRDAVIEGLRDGTIDVICTDHAPHTEYEKSEGFYEAPFGIVGLETCVGLTYTHLVKTGMISFKKMIEYLSINPRRILNIDVPLINEGSKANLTLLEVKKKWKVDKNKFRSKSRNTPFNGYSLECKPYAVINNNKIFYSDL